MELRGRQAERAAIDRLLADAREGLSGALVLRGEPGIGKTALVDDAQAKATSDFQILRVVGVEAESGFAYGVLYRLLVPFGAEIEALPATACATLNVAFGLDAGPAADLHVVGLAALTLLADIAADRPLLVCIDDAQWVDAESLGALAVVARRIFGEGIAMLFASRLPSADDARLAALPELQLDGLDHANALHVLHVAIDGPIDAALADRIVHDTGGNPLALTDFGGEWSSYSPPGGVPLDEPVPIGPRLEAHYLERVRSLSPATQTWLLLAAAEPAGDAGYVAAAARAMNVPDDAATAAEQAGIVFSRSRVEFRHPLVRSAVYNGAPSADRRRAHAALTEATTRGRDADRRARHRAAASTAPDEEVATELVRAADRAETRGGFAARAELMTRAAALTPGDVLSARRLLSAAQSSLTAGMMTQTGALLDQLAAADLDDAGIARAMTIRGDVAIIGGEPNVFGTAAATSVRAAELLVATDPDAASDALARACRYTINAEHLLAEITALELADAVVRLTSPSETPTAEVLLANAFATWMHDGYEAAVPAVRAAVAKLLEPGIPPEKLLSHFVLGVMLCTATWEKNARAALLARVDEVARASGALNELDTVKFCVIMIESGDGRMDAAESHLAESLHLRSVLGATADMWEIYKYPELLGWRARDAHVNEALQGTIDAAAVLGIGAMVSIAYNGIAILELGRSNYDAAFAAAMQTFGVDPVGVDSRGLPNLIEAAVRSGHRAEAEFALAEFDRRATASGTVWVLGLLERSRALLADDALAEEHYRNALTMLRDADARADVARSHLLYGEWLRRAKRKSDAREHLRTAHAMFAEMGADAFAERARLELAATGEQARKRADGTARDLTPQELQVARLAAAGDTNAEIGERLYISARTVDYHLRKVYRKLDITSRRELRRFFPAV